MNKSFQEKRKKCLAGLWQYNCMVLSGRDELYLFSSKALCFFPREVWVLFTDNQYKVKSLYNTPCLILLRLNLSKAGFYLNRVQKKKGYKMMCANTS